MAKRDDNPWVQAGRFMGLGVILPFTAFVGYAIGYALDLLFHTAFLRVVFLIFGVVGGFLETLREARRANNE